MEQAPSGPGAPAPSSASHLAEISRSASPAHRQGTGHRMNTAPFFDIHLHSSYSSDGEWTVERLFAEAEKLGMIELGISDHDTLSALQHRVQMERSFPSVEGIPNVGVSSGHRGQELHLLSPFVDP